LKITMRLGMLQEASKHDQAEVELLKMMKKEWRHQ